MKPLLAKYLLFLFLLCSFCVVGVATISSTPAPVVVVENTWLMGRQNSLDMTLGCRPYETGQECYCRHSYSSCEGEYRAGLVAASSPDFYAAKAPDRLPEFIYRTLVRNIGEHKIKAMTWDYVFSNPLNGDELSRHSFLSHTEIRPGRIAVLFGISLKPPTNVISISALSAKSQGYSERVEVRGVLFENGSRWGSVMKGGM